MKDPAALLSDIARRLERTWAAHLSGEEVAWPHRFSLGATTKATLESGWQSTYQPLIRTWQHWERDRAAVVHVESKRVYTTIQQVPVAVSVHSIEDAVSLVGNGWPERLPQAAERLRRIDDRFPGVSDRARLLRRIVAYSDVDFALLLQAADWFTTHHGEGFTPRQVPIPGVHAKWLNTHQPDILALTGRDTLGLLPRHPARIHFTYLDPDYRATGARHHDSATVGDPFTPPYPPQVVVISENKDTAIHFPALPGGIAVEGAGYGGGTAAAFGWITAAPRLYYWGDIDAHGYEILNGFRDAGVPVVSILMDLPTYDEFEPYGTNIDASSRPLTVSTPKSLPRLTGEERAVYERLTAPEWHKHRRIEQERIPLDRAHALIKA